MSTTALWAVIVMIAVAVPNIIKWYKNWKLWIFVTIMIILGSYFGNSISDAILSAMFGMSISSIIRAAIALDNLSPNN